MNPSRRIPIAFVPGHLAVNEAQAFEMLGLNDGRSERAKKWAFKKFRDEHEIKPLPGFVFSVKRLTEAAQAER